MKQIGMIYTGVLTRRYLQVHQYLQRQSTDERSTFDSEYIAMKTAVEMINALRYKLKTFVTEIGSFGVFYDIESTKNTRNPESTLSRKHNAIAYHLC